MIRILLIDDHLLLRQGTAALLAQDADLEIIGEAGDGETGIQLAHRLGPDVVLLDIRLPDMSGVDVARILRQELPAIKVIIVSSYHHEQYVRALFAIGVHGYVLKNASGPELISAVRAVCRGETALSSEVAVQMVNKTQRAGIAANPELSERERDVLRLVAEGASNKDIAYRLSIGVRTVETHVSNAMSKLGAKSRLEAITIAAQRGIILFDPS